MDATRTDVKLQTKSDNFDVYASQEMIKHAIENRINALYENIDKTRKTYTLYFIFTFMIVIVLQGLTLLFENIHDREDNKDKNELKKST